MGDHLACGDLEDYVNARVQTPEPRAQTSVEAEKRLRESGFRVLDSEKESSND